MESVVKSLKMASVERKARYSRDSDHVRAQLSHLREEERKEAEESFLVYCKPVDFYMMLQSHAKKNPSFLQRCLEYKIQEKKKGRQVKPGNVTFYYKYYKNMLEKSEVRKQYRCPFCQAKCASYKGLESHLLASHDRFRYEFVVHDGYEDVIVYAKTTTRTSDILGKMVHPTKDVFFYCRKPMRRRGCQTANQVGPLALDLKGASAGNVLRGVSELMDRELYGGNSEPAS